MKKRLFLMLLIVAPIAMYAQLKVGSAGTMMVGGNSPVSNTDIGINTYYYPDYKHNISARLYPVSGLYNIGVLSQAYSNTVYTQGRSIGVMGVGGNLSLNYGVIGGLYGSMPGAAVLGLLSNGTGIAGMIGQYAGYFDGATYVAGLLTANTVAVPSDIRLAENIVSLKSIAKGDEETIEKIMTMDVIRYNDADISRFVSDTLPAVQKPAPSDKKTTHYGLLAEELQKVYPDLVIEGQDGYYAINYLELVPILVRSIQELKQKVDYLEGYTECRETNSRNMATTITTTESAIVSSNVLYQNTPNPFKEQTVIRFSLANDAHDAAICIFDMTGKMLKKMLISSGETSVSVNGWELGAGMFLYTLMVNGQEIDTKRMIIMN